MGLVALGRRQREDGHKFWYNAYWKDRSGKVGVKADSRKLGAAACRQEGRAPADIGCGRDAGLRMPWPSDRAVGELCFNPYRVFKCAATAGPGRHPIYRRRVSIPIGFSSALRH